MMLRYHWIIALSLTILHGACTNNTKKSSLLEENKFLKVGENEMGGTGIKMAKNETELRLEELNIVDVQLIAPDVLVDLKYASSKNFTGIQLYDTLTKAYLQKDVAEKINKCQNYLDSIKPGFKLLIYDAIRPVSVQKTMWQSLDSIPVTRRGKYVSNPINKSVHNYGAAVDITIVDLNGKPLDMGAEYDDFRDIAQPSMEWKYKQSGELTSDQLANRILLRKVMIQEGFIGIPGEWWHFNAYTREQCRVKFPLLLTESGDVIIP